MVLELKRDINRRFDAMDDIIDIQVQYYFFFSCLSFSCNVRKITSGSDGRRLLLSYLVANRKLSRV